MVNLGRKEILDDGCARCNGPDGRNGVGLDSSDKVGEHVLALTESLVVRS